MIDTKFIIFYSELSLKGKKKLYFKKILKKNISFRLNKNSISFKLEDGYDHFILSFDSEKENFIIELLKKISGISWFSKILEFNSDKESIESNFSKNLKFLISKDSFSYKLEAKDYDKNIFSSSLEFIDFLAKIIKSKYPNSKVDLENYDYKIKIQIKKNKCVLFFDKINGLIGLPAGSNGKMLALLSGGIDSPVAAIKTITRGYNVSFITFLNYNTGTEETIEKIKSLANKINEYNGIDQELYIINFSNIQEKIASLPHKNYRLILLKRQFLKFASFIAKKNNFSALITGENLGQVSSQTIEGLASIEYNLNFPIIRPLISYSKQEIITQAKKYQTYQISIKQGDDTCKLFNPSAPVTYPKLEKTLKIEALLGNLLEIYPIVLDKYSKKLIYY